MGKAGMKQNKNFREVSNNGYNRINRWNSHGKTTASNILRSFGATIIDADHLARRW